jgi:ABC-2 type transport system ATP-binding protein
MKYRKCRASGNELSALGLPFTVNGRVIVPYTESAQDVIARLQTRLTLLRIHEPSLEDAYVEFLNRTGRDAA